MFSLDGSIGGDTADERRGGSAVVLGSVESRLSGREAVSVDVASGAGFKGDGLAGDVSGMALGVAIG